MRPAIARYLRRLERPAVERGLTPAAACHAGQRRLRHGRRVPAAACDDARRPARRCAGGRDLPRRAARRHQLITIDMGGTSFDVCSRQRRTPAISRNAGVEEQPLGVPGVEVHSIGAGGGSIAGSMMAALSASGRAVPARGQGRLLRLGRRRTDGNRRERRPRLPLADAFLGGRRQLRRDLAESSISASCGRPARTPLDRPRPASCGSSRRTWSARFARCRSSAASTRAGSY